VQINGRRIWAPRHSRYRDEKQRRGARTCA
jgi:hypothetical protein